MKNASGISRRNFLKQTSLGLGASIAAAPLISLKSEGSAGQNLLSKINAITIDLRGLWNEPRQTRVKKVLSRMGEIAGFKPDIICLPELFDTLRTPEKFQISEIAEDENSPGGVCNQIAEFARKYNCYLVCPIFTRKEGRYYNSSILINRKGAIAGIYNKMHPSSQEISKGVTAGKLNQPLFETDFGKVGIQIGEDACWSEGWDHLKSEGANLILYSSGFPGGRILNHYALKNNCYIISSTANDGRIINISGDDLHSTSTFIRYGWAAINLEKRNISHLPDYGLLEKLFSKYGNRVEVKIWDHNWVATIESHDPGLRILEVMKDLKISEAEEYYIRSEAVQKKYRL